MELLRVGVHGIIEGHCLFFWPRVYLTSAAAEFPVINTSGPRKLVHLGFRGFGLRVWE